MDEAELRVAGLRPNLVQAFSLWRALCEINACTAGAESALKVKFANLQSWSCVVALT